MKIENAEVTDVKITEVTEVKLEDPASKLDPEVARVADITEAALTGKFDTNGTAVVDKAVYLEQILTESLPRDVVERFMGHHRAVQAGFALGAGRAGFKFMQDNPDVKVVRADLPTLGKDHYAVKVTQQRDVAGTPSFGLVQVSHEVYGGGKDDPLVQVKSILSNQARSIWQKL